MLLSCQSSDETVELGDSSGKFPCNARSKEVNEAGILICWSLQFLFFSSPRIPPFSPFFRILWPFRRPFCLFPARNHFLFIFLMFSVCLHPDYLLWLFHHEREPMIVFARLHYLSSLPLISLSTVISSLAELLVFPNLSYFKHQLSLCSWFVTDFQYARAGI